MQLKGKVHKYGPNVDTDVIIPARRLNTTDPKELGRHAMEDLDPRFAEKVNPGDIIVAEENFGCGSSREHAPIALKAAGIGCVIASSFARIFFRNALNTGLPIMECPEAVAGSDAGDELETDLDTGVIRNLTKGTEFKAKPMPGFMQELINDGGLLNHLRERLGARG